MKGFLNQVTIQGFIVGFVVGCLLMYVAGVLRPPA